MSVVMVRRYELDAGAQRQQTTGRVVKVLGADADRRGVSLWTLEQQESPGEQLTTFVVGTGERFDAAAVYGMPFVGVAKAEAAGPDTARAGVSLFYLHVWAKVTT